MSKLSEYFLKEEERNLELNTTDMTTEQAEEIKRAFRNVSALGKDFVENVFMIAEGALSSFLEGERPTIKVDQLTHPSNKIGLLNRKQLAEMLGVSLRTISELQAEGMPCLYFNKSVRFDYQEVLKWTQGRKICPRRKDNLRVVA